MILILIPAALCIAYAAFMYAVVMPSDDWLADTGKASWLDDGAG